MKITKKELKQIIKEEAFRFQKKLQLENELSEVQTQLDEVEAGGEVSVSSAAWTGERGGDKKFKPEFEKLSRNGGFPALKEEDKATEECGDVIAEEGIDETLEEILAEIMSEDDEAEDGRNDEEDEEINGDDDKLFFEEGGAFDDAKGIDYDTPHMKSQLAAKGQTPEEAKAELEENMSTLNEEQIRMRQLAGIKPLNS